MGRYNNEIRDDPISVYSCTGYVVFYFGCPVLWVSKMKSEISLSTDEPEYAVLSTIMRGLVPFTDQVKELSDVFHQDDLKVQIHCTLSHSI